MGVGWGVCVWISAVENELCLGLRSGLLCSGPVAKRPWGRSGLWSHLQGLAGSPALLLTARGFFAYKVILADCSQPTLSPLPGTQAP